MQGRFHLHTHYAQCRCKQPGCSVRHPVCSRQSVPTSSAAPRSPCRWAMRACMANCSCVVMTRCHTTFSRTPCVGSPAPLAAQTLQRTSDCLVSPHAVRPALSAARWKRCMLLAAPPRSQQQSMTRPNCYARKGQPSCAAQQHGHVCPPGQHSAWCTHKLLFNARQQPHREMASKDAGFRCSDNTPRA